MPVLESNYNYFLETNLSNYSGKWIAIYGGEIVSHGDDLKRVAEEAEKKCKDKRFLLVKVPSGETMIF
ncbi:MAG: succinyl-CoA synthetase subunit alpha [Nanoarchaeota archaeon]|nr:succinyl-CoA synthetase subunit alpha [Nanoarchaeota archaeon]